MSDPTPRPAGPERDDAKSRGRALLGSFTRRDTTGLAVFTVGTFLTVSVAWSLVAGTPEGATDVNASTALVLALTSAVGAWPLLFTGVAALAVGAGLFLTTRAAEGGKLAIALTALLPALSFLWAGLGGSGGALAGVLAGAEAGFGARLASLALGLILLAAATYAFAAALGKATEWKQVLVARIATAGSRRRNPDEGRTGRQDGDRAEDTPGARATHGTSTEQVPRPDAAGPRAIGAADPSGRRRADAHLAADAATAVRGAEPRPLGGAARSQDDAAAALSDPAPVPRALEESDEPAIRSARPLGGVATEEPEEAAESAADEPAELFAEAAGVRPYQSSAGAAVAEPEVDEAEEEPLDAEEAEDLEADEDEELEAEDDEELEAEEDEDLEAEVDEELEAEEEEDEELEAEDDEELEAEEDEDLEAEDDEELEAEEDEELEAEDDEELEAEEDEELEAEGDEELEAEEDEELEAEGDEELEAEEDEELESEDDEELAAEEAAEAPEADAEADPIEAEVEAPAADAEEAPVAAEADDQPGLFADDQVEDGVGAAAVAPEPAPAKRSRKKAPAADPVAEAIEPVEAAEGAEPEVVVEPAPPRTRTRNERRKAARRAAQAAAAPPDLDPDALVYEAGNLFLAEGRVAVSMLQKRWGLDFDQSTAILDRLQELGLIGPYLGGKPRQILLTEDQWRSAATEQA